MRQTQSPSEYAVAKTIKVIEQNGMARLAQSKFQARRPVLRVIDESALHVHIAQRAMTARELRICRKGTVKISFGLVEPWGGESP